MAYAISNMFDRQCTAGSFKHRGWTQGQVEGEDVANIAIAPGGRVQGEVK